MDSCLLKLLTFYQKLLWNIRSRLTFSTFSVFRPRFRYVGTKYADFDQIYLNAGPKAKNVEELRLDLIFHDDFW